MSSCLFQKCISFHFLPAILHSPHNHLTPAAAPSCAPLQEVLDPHVETEEYASFPAGEWAALCAAEKNGAAYHNKLQMEISS